MKEILISLAIPLGYGAGVAIGSYLNGRLGWSKDAEKLIMWWPFLLVAVVIGAALAPLWAPVAVAFWASDKIKDHGRVARARAEDRRRSLR